MVERGMRRVELAVFAAVLTAVTLLLGAAGSSTTSLARAVGSAPAAELRSGTGVSSAQSAGDRIGAAVRGARHAGGRLAVAAGAFAYGAPASGTGGTAATFARQLTPIALAALGLLAGAALLAPPMPWRPRPKGRAPPLISGT